MANDFLNIPFLRVDSEKAIITCHTNAPAGRRRENGKNLKTDRKKAYKGVITKKSQKSIYRRINEWCEVIKEGNSRNSRKTIKLVLLTVTLASEQDWAGNMPDKKVKALLLEPLIKYLKYNFDVKNYFWKAETQKNGNIHFHVLTDRYLPKEKVERFWNKKMNEYGLMDDYKIKYGNEAPPSCNIRVFDMNDESIAYLSKYVSKVQDRRKVEGLQYRFSNSIKYLKPVSVCVADSGSQGILDMIEKEATRVVGDEYFRVYYLKWESICRLKNSPVLSSVKSHRLILFDLIYRYQLNEDVFRLVYLFHYTRKKVMFSTIEDVMQHLSIDVATAVYLQRKGLIALGAAMQPLAPSSPMAGFQPATAVTQHFLTF